VVEPNRDSTQSKEDGHPVANDHCPGMIDLEPLTAMQFDREYAEWLARVQRLEFLIKVVGCH
jgi:hypothetical protein